jgi:hypothetical protein
MYNKLKVYISIPTILIILISVFSPLNVYALDNKKPYTVLVYFNGSDLESAEGASAATSDLKEMMAVGSTENINVILETGGTKEWKTPQISNLENQRWKVEKNGITLIKENLGNRSMGSSSTLEDFVTWGIENYPAEKYALIFWNHGAGAVHGFGSDELNSDTSLTLDEIKNAMDISYNKTGEKLELVGFDACLMATLETAYTLNPYSNYLVASEELEPGHGWDYTPILSAINNNPDIDGKHLGIAIADGFKNQAISEWTDESITLSVTNLTKIPNVMTAFDSYIEVLNNDLNNDEKFNLIAKARGKSEDYGSSSFNSSDMVDLSHMAENTLKTYPEKSQELINAISDSISYNIKSSSKPNANGLSIYFPYKNKENFKYNLSIYKNLDFSNNYKSFIQKYVEIVLSDSTPIEFTDNSPGLNDTQNTPTQEENDNTDNNYDDYYYDYYDEYYDNFDYDSYDNLYDYYDDLYDYYNELYDDYYNNFGYDNEFNFGNSNFESSNSLLEVQINQEDIPQIDEIYSLLGVYNDENKEEIIFLSMDNDVYLDYETGIIKDNFTGYSMTLNNNFVSMFLTDYDYYDDGYFYEYSIPAILNEIKVELIAVFNEKYPEGHIIGAWEGINETTYIPDKELIKVKIGDSITPLYYFENDETFESGYIEGQEFFVEEELSLGYSTLPEGTYVYGFYITDIAQNYSYSDFIDITLNGEISENSSIIQTDNGYEFVDNYNINSNDISVKIDNREIYFDVSPVIENGRTLVPLRSIFESLGLKVTWDDKTRTVTGTKEDLIITLQIGNNKATLNGHEIELDVPATIKDGRTLVPVRFIAESTGYNVDWDGNNRTVLISTY